VELQTLQQLSGLISEMPWSPAAALGFDFKGDRQSTNNLPGRSERLPVVAMVASDTSTLELMLQNAADHIYPTPTYLFDPSARLTLLKFLSERWCKALHDADVVDNTAMCVLNACAFAGCWGAKQITCWNLHHLLMTTSCLQVRRDVNG